MARFDGETAAKILRWIHALKKPPSMHGPCWEASKKMPQDVQSIGSDAFGDYLKDGLALGYLMACVNPNSVTDLLENPIWEVSDKTTFEKLRQKERIRLFLQFLTSLDIDSSNQFSVSALNEKLDLERVVQCLREVALMVETQNGYIGPVEFRN
ncbi:hypothetical protein CRM22_004233 [Opisthorchis felineus]|uniref:Calponin-homology (CH) domain-containing protein n=1 Tax=Opisthorchis felineus TaxID=147828 RepID=A0A4S2M2E8_OPIFE|nr:hypothetical protein CRM22_004233 [Opisthorchis felineus]TGZ68479.1 hypothetical protein CRM22_004233 [Opisthorchis felineus]TGZ68480.1 hypothetical protein CRM22_004233 [Opisthorchis felineus]